MHPHTIQTMAVIEEEENIESFLEQHTTSFDCSERALLFRRYLYRGDAERFEPERRYQLYRTFNNLLYPRHLLKWGEDKSNNDYADDFMEAMLSLIRRDAVDDRPDIWLSDRMELGLKTALRLISSGNQEQALLQIEKVVKLLEEIMRITDEVLLPTSCRFLNGMEWRAKEDWKNPYNDPNALEERMIFIHTYMNGVTTCYCVYPSNMLRDLQGKNFDALKGNLKFEELCERVKALIITKQKES